MSSGPLIPEGLNGRLALIRHAQTAWVTEDRFQGWQDPPLSDTGRREALLVAQRLVERAAHPELSLPADTPVAIWHSPLVRAADTARAIAAALPGVSLVPSRDMIEIGAGRWEGQLHSDVAKADGERLAQWRIDPTLATAPDGEPIVDAAARIQRGLRDVLEDLSKSGMDDPWDVIVGHGGTLRLALLSLLEIPYSRFWAFPFRPCAISVVQITNARATLVTHNATDHLAPLMRVSEMIADVLGDAKTI